MDTRSQGTGCIHFNGDNEVINSSSELKQSAKKRLWITGRFLVFIETVESIRQFAVHNEVENRLPIRRANMYSLELPYWLVLLVSTPYRLCKLAMQDDHVKKPSIWSRHDTGAWDTMSFFGALSAMRLSMVRRPNLIKAWFTKIENYCNC